MAAAETNHEVAEPEPEPNPEPSESPTNESPKAGPSTDSVDNAEKLQTPPSSPTMNGHTVGPIKPAHTGPKYKLLTEGDIQLCRLNHTRTIVSKIMNSKYLRRWESHHIILTDSAITSETVGITFLPSLMQQSIKQATLEQPDVFSRGSSRVCIHMPIVRWVVLCYTAVHLSVCPSVCPKTPVSAR